MCSLHENTASFYTVDLDIQGRKIRSSQKQFRSHVKNDLIEFPPGWTEPQHTLPSMWKF